MICNRHLAGSTIVAADFVNPDGSSVKDGDRGGGQLCRHCGAKILVLGHGGFVIENTSGHWVKTGKNTLSFVEAAP